jgi:type II secretory pathway component PulF
MPVYSYKAFDTGAQAVAGSVIADTPRQARDELRAKGLSVAEVSPARGGATVDWLERHRGRRGQSEAVAAVRELATLLGAGITLLSALDTLVRQHKGHFRSVLQGIRDRVSSGVSLADAMAERPAWFDELSVNIVRVGENTGTLESALVRLAEFREKGEYLRNRVTTALIYPAVVLTIGLGVMTFLMTYVVPQLLSTLVEAGRPLPWPTWIVKSVSDCLLHWWWLILAAGLGLVFGVRALLRTDRGRWAYDRLVLKIPLVGDLIRKENTSRLSVVMAALLRSGLPFDEAIRITRRTLRNRVFRRAMDDYETAVMAGRDIAGPLESSGVFTPLVVQMLAVGQQSGELEGMLERLSQAYDREIATATQRLTALLEPLLIVVLAIMVGFIAFATILPILEINNVL